MNEEDIKRSVELIEKAEKIVIVGHKSPDGDSVGSSLGVYHTLKKFKSNIKVCMPDPYPSFLQFLEGTDGILNFEQNPELVQSYIEESDLIFCLDFNSFSRVGKMEAILTKATAKKIMIDHHQDPDHFADISFSFPDECSTSQLIYKFLRAGNYLNYFDKVAGECLYCGIMTDTGSFKFPSTTAETHRIIADLMDVGVNNYKVHEQVFDMNTEDKIKLRSHILSTNLKVYHDYKTAIIRVTEQELEQYGYEKGDTEGLVNVALSLKTVNRAAFFTENDGLIKISFRSKGVENPVNSIANKYFEGGGHINAAGGKFVGNMEDAIAKFVTVLPEFV